MKTPHSYTAQYDTEKHNVNPYIKNIHIIYCVLLFVLFMYTVFLRNMIDDIYLRLHDINGLNSNYYSLRDDLNRLRSEFNTFKILNQ